MEIIRKQAHARAGLIGNPSDGYNGKTISIAIVNYRAQVVLYEWEDVEIIPSQEDHSRFDSISDLVADVKLHGYYGGIRIVKATIKRFVEYCAEQGVSLHDRNFSIRYETNIPRQVGLAGSSAIVVATLRALMEFYKVEIPQHVQPSLVLSVENMELGITAGLQDRVIQVYDGSVYMDFAANRMFKDCGYECGTYEYVESPLLAQLYVAFSTDVSEPTEVFHNNLRARFDSGEKAVVDAMTKFSSLAEQARASLLADDYDNLSKSIDENFDTRLSICQLPSEHVDMIQRARRSGASAKFAGSGGAIIGTFRDDAMYTALTDDLAQIGCTVFKPQITSPE
ncbi:MAG: GHMP kinase [Planctomycetaceae bacterium]|nr:GHMP kinase [Planctomycetaceae bacterium]